MSELYKKLESTMKEISALAQAAGLLSWDQETMMPSKAALSRAEQSSALVGIVHEKFVSPENGKMLEELSSKSSELTEDEKVCVREWMRDYKKSVKIPDSLVRELTKTTALAHEAWIDARKKSKFAIFAPWLEKIVDLKKQEAHALGFKDTPYDALLDEYEPRMTVKELDPVIKELRDGLVPIAHAIANSGVKVDVKVLEKNYPVAEQEALAKELSLLIGFDSEAGRIDRSVHPFCSGISSTDVRITNRYKERWLPECLYGVMHETGHALYEQGLPAKHANTPLAEAVSLAIHESQSRLWENIIGRSRAFASFLTPKLKKRFKTQTKGINAETIYRAVNRVEFSPIRTEADEVTYNLHVMLRYEIERPLVEGEIKVKDLPVIWNDKMKKYLGFKPKNDAMGVLQDTHWSGGMIGYFPTYLLGNLYAAQWWNAICKNIKDVEGKIAKGEFKPILKWLRKNIHEHGRRYSPIELATKATGESLKAKYFIDYLKKKYGEIYNIREW